jgi:hypothetical protein
MKQKIIYILLWVLSISHISIIAEEIKLLPMGGTYSVPVVLNDTVKLHFIVDSGAADVTMPFDTFMTLLRANTIHKRDIFGKKQFQMANGAIETFYVFNLKKMQIGSQYIYNVRASSSQHMKASLLLGQSALRKLEPWRLDTKKGVLYIRDKGLPPNNMSNKRYYVVQPGDTLYSIAKTNNIDLSELKRINGIGNDNIISIGQKLKLTQQHKNTSVYHIKTIPFTYEDSKKACAKNISMGCINLGLMYEDGNGVQANTIKAFDFYQKACNLGDARGCFNTGVMYRDGKGVKQDYEKASKIFGKSCKAGDAFACSDLGVMYYLGIGIKKDLGIAKFLFKKACDLGDTYGCRNYSEIHRKRK